MLTGIEFFDNSIVKKGFQEGSVILVAGEPGTGKTIFASQIVYNVMKKNKNNCIYVSFSENKTDYFKEMASIGMNFNDLENAGLFKFMDLVTVEPKVIENEIELIMKEIISTSPKFIIIDSVSALVQLMGKEKTRIFLHTTLGRFIKAIGSIVLLIAEKPYGENKIGYGIEEFVVDGVIVLKMEKVKEANRRILEIKKMRGKEIKRPQYEFVITDSGIEFLEVPELVMNEEESSTERITTGLPKLDELLDGGVFADSITLIAGQTGTGKTTLGLHFVIQNAIEGKNAVLISFEEQPGNLIRQARIYGLPIDKVLDKKLTIYSWIPEAQTPVDFFIKIKKIIERKKPRVLVIDSLTSMRQKMDNIDLIKLLRYFQLLIKSQKIATYMTLFLGEVKGNIIPLTGVSTLADNIITLQYKIKNEEVKRQMTIVKARGTKHSRLIQNYEINSKGVVIE